MVHLEAREPLRSSKQRNGGQDLCLRKLCGLSGAQAAGGQAWNLGALGKGGHTLQLRDSDEDLTRTVAIG